MPASYGAWLDRRSGRLIEIEDHARNALANPKRYRIDGILAELNRPLSPLKDREDVIRMVAMQGFLRIA